MAITLKQHAGIWTQEVMLCALRSVPVGGKVAEVIRDVRQRYDAIQTADRLSAVESELTTFHIKMRDMVEQTVTEAMEALKQPNLDGATLTRLVKEFNSINEAGYNTALFEGLFLGTSHHESLKRMPLSYGSVLNPGATIEPGHFPILIELDGQDRILSVPPASLSQVLSEASGKGDSRIIRSNDIFAVHDLIRKKDTTIDTPLLAEDIPILMRAEAYRYEGDYVKAIRQYTGYLQQCDDSREDKCEFMDVAYMGRGKCFAVLGSYNAAILDFSAVIEKLDKDCIVVMESFERRADVYKTQGAYEAAVSDYIEALKTHKRPLTGITYHEAKEEIVRLMSMKKGIIKRTKGMKSLLLRLEQGRYFKNSEYHSYV